MSIRDFNFAIDPTFDPARMPKGKRKALNSCEVTMMMPFSVQCDTCSAFIYKGKKLNSTKEDILGGNYKGIKLIRFTMKCSTCNGKFCIRTDPEHMDYAVEKGVQRNFEPWRQNEAVIQAALTKRAEDEKYDAMRALENRTLDSKRQMDQLDALEELKSIRATQAGMTPEDLIEFLEQRDRDLSGGGDDGEDVEGGGGSGVASSGRGGARNAAQAAAEAEDAALAAAAFQHTRRPTAATAADAVLVADVTATAGIKRLRQDDEEADGGLASASGAAESNARLSTAFRGASTPALFVRPVAGSGVSGGVRLPVGVSRLAAASLAVAAKRPVAASLVVAGSAAEGPTATPQATDGPRANSTTARDAVAVAPANTGALPRPSGGLVADYGTDEED